jgi:hypothetical protein
LMGWSFGPQLMILEIGDFSIQSAWFKKGVSQETPFSLIEIRGWLL